MALYHQHCRSQMQDESLLSSVMELASAKDTKSWYLMEPFIEVPALSFNCIHCHLCNIWINGDALSQVHVLIEVVGCCIFSRAANEPLSNDEEGYIHSEPLQFLCYCNQTHVEKL